MTAPADHQTDAEDQFAHDPYDVGAGDDSDEGRVFHVTGQDWDEVVAAAAADERSDERLIVNMGPQHPSTHGVLRLVLTLDGETVTEVRPVIGYLHTGIEKNMEFRTWTQGVTFCTRMDYLAPLFNETVYCLAVEKLLGIESEIPERATVIRVVEPISIPPVARHTRCEEIRFSSIISTRMIEARSGMPAVTPSSRSTARQ